MVGGDSFSLEISDTDNGVRLDVVVANLVADCSRSAATDWIRKGFVQVQGEQKKSSYRVRIGDRIAVHLPPPFPIDIKPEPIDFDIIYEDESLIVINKCAGMVVHPAPGHSSGTVVNGLLYRYPEFTGKSGEVRPGIVHRLDKDTSGILIVAKNAIAHEAISNQFKARQVQKKYIALVHGELKTSHGEIIAPIGRHPTDRKKMSIHSKRGRYAETHWKIKERFPEFTLLELDIKTGRTHQIRVHLASILHPIVADPVYGRRSPSHHGDIKKDTLRRQLISVNRQMLHAWQLSLRHPQENKLLIFQSPIPQDMQAVINLLKRETA